MYKKILVAVDGSEIASRAAAHAIQLAKETGASLKAVSVLDTRTFPGGHPVVPESMAPYYFSLMDELRSLADKALDHVSGDAEKAGVTIETEVLEGTPADAIKTAAKEGDIDLIVMGTHGRTGLAALVLGSTAQGVVHEVHIPVLLVR